MLRPEIVPGEPYIVLGPPKVDQSVLDALEVVDHVARCQEAFAEIDRVAKRLLWPWTETVALLERGYRLDHVVERSGWPEVLFCDLPIDEDGYLIQG